MINNRKSGIATIEALLILPLFMGFIFAFISFASLGYVESRMQHAADQAAKEISQYYYVAYVLGLNYGGIKSNQDVDKLFDSIDALTSDANKAVNTGGSLVNNVSNASNQISSIATNGNFSDSQAKALYNLVNTSVSQTTDLWGLVKVLVGDIKTVWSSAKNAATVGNVKSISGNTAAAVIHAALSPVISEACFWKYYSNSPYNDNGKRKKTASLKSEADISLKSLGIVNGSEGVSFAGSAFMMDGQSIKVVVSYSVNLFTLGQLNIGEMHLCQVAITRAWIGGEDEETGVPSIKTYK